MEQRHPRILITIAYLQDFPELHEIKKFTMEKLKTLLIANRGEIAVRIAKTAK
jgi:hypothetical protein